MAKVILRYVYTFYNFGEVLAEDTVTQTVDVSDGCRFVLKYQDDSSFMLSEVREDYKGKYIILTYPNKDNTVVYEGESAELCYDEYNNDMGDDNHNVYVGTVTLEL